MYDYLPQNLGIYISSYLKPSQRKQASVSHSLLQLNKKTIKNCINQLNILFEKRLSNLFTIIDLINYLYCNDDEIFIQDDFQIHTIKNGKIYYKYIIDLISPTIWCIEIKYKNKSKEIYFKWNQDEKKIIKFIFNELLNEKIIVNKVSSPCGNKKQNTLSLEEINKLIEFEIIEC